MNEIAANRLRTVILQAPRGRQLQLESPPPLRDSQESFVSSELLEKSFRPQRLEFRGEKEAHQRGKEHLLAWLGLSATAALAVYHPQLGQWLSSLPAGQIDGTLVGAAIATPLACALATPLIGGVESESKSRRILTSFGAAGLAAGAALGSFVGPMVAKMLA